MVTVCEKDMCAGCMACIDICPKDAITIRDSLHAYNAVIDTDNVLSVLLVISLSGGAETGLP